MVNPQDLRAVGQPEWRRGVKSAAAFRTISEVATDLSVPQHVLRFWETRFSQLKPIKRAGGRRYYRPEDIDLLRRIRALLYQDGYTIKGAQKLLREGKPVELRRPVATVANPVPQIVPASVAASPNARPKDREALRAALDELVELRRLLKSRGNHGG
jgi:DNA-binding transcriptional MerR regulator